MEKIEIICICPPTPHPVVKNQNTRHFFLISIKQRGGFSREKPQGMGFFIMARLKSASLGQKDRKKPHPRGLSLEDPNRSKKKVHAGKVIYFLYLSFEITLFLCGIRPVDLSTTPDPQDIFIV